MVRILTMVSVFSAIRIHITIEGGIHFAGERARAAAYMNGSVARPLWICTTVIPAVLRCVAILAIHLYLCFEPLALRRQPLA